IPVSRRVSAPVDAAGLELRGPHRPLAPAGAARASAAASPDCQAGAVESDGPCSRPNAARAEQAGHAVARKLACVLQALWPDVATSERSRLEGRGLELRRQGQWRQLVAHESDPHHAILRLRSGLIRLGLAAAPQSAVDALAAGFGTVAEQWVGNARVKLSRLE